MKRLFYLLIMLLLFIPTLSFATDTTAVDVSDLDKNGVRTYRWELYDDGGDGIVTGTKTKPITGLLLGVRLIPDDTGNVVLSGDYQPSNEWNGEVRDQYGQDLLQGEGASTPNVFTSDYELYFTPVTKDSSGNVLGLIYLKGQKLYAYVSSIGLANAVVVEVYVKETAGVR